jgi:hypothetical protein
MVRLLAGSESGAKNDGGKRQAFRMEFHGRSPLYEVAARDRRKTRDPKFLAQEGTTREAEYNLWDGRMTG